MIWGYLRWFEAIWADLRLFELIWGYLRWFEAIWADLRLFEMIWGYLSWFEAIWDDLRLFELIWGYLRCSVCWCVLSQFELNWSELRGFLAYFWAYFLSQIEWNWSRLVPFGAVWAGFWGWVSAPRWVVAPWLSQWKMRRCWNHFSQRSLLNWCWWLLLWHLLWQLAWWTSVWIIVMVFGKLLAHLTVGSVRHVNSKDFALDVSTWRKGMTSTRRKPGRTWNFSGEGPNQGRFGSVFPALSTANGPSSTMPLMRERNSWRPINGGSAVCFGVWMTSSRTPWRMTPCARSISNGLTHVEDGKNHLWSTWRSIWATTAGSGLIVVLMAATTGWRIQQVNTSSARNGSSRPLTSSSTRTSEQRLVQDLILTLGFKDKKLLVVPTIPGEWFKQLPVFGGNNIGFWPESSPLDYEGGLQVFQWPTSWLWRSRPCPRPLSLWSSITLRRPSS